jgi:hypothetical protein
VSEMIPADDPPDDTGEFLFYQTDDAKSRIQLRLHDGNVWLTQRQLSDLYQVSLPTVNEHLATFTMIRNYRQRQLSGNSG